MKPIIAIYGPTHSGKTDLAKALYSKYPSELISVDSVQIYKHLDIGSNKPTKEELEKFPHHLIDILEANEKFSVGDFKKRSLKIIKKADEQSKIPIFVGGTMMYFYSLLEGLADLPKRDDLIRVDLSCDLETFGLASLFKRLEKIDPEAAEKIHPHDTQRIIRALEVCLITNDKFSEILKKENQKNLLNRKIFSFAVIPEDRVNYKKDLKVRFNAMLSKGFVNEVKSIIKKFSKEAPPLNSVGYRQCVEFLNGELSEEEFITKSVNATYQLAKRQITWLNKLTTTKIFEKEEMNKVIKIESFL